MLKTMCAVLKCSRHRQYQSAAAMRGFRSRFTIKPFGALKTSRTATTGPTTMISPCRQCAIAGDESPRDGDCSRIAGGAEACEFGRPRGRCFGDQKGRSVACRKIMRQRKSPTPRQGLGLKGIQTHGTKVTAPYLCQLNAALLRQIKGRPVACRAACGQT